MRALIAEDITSSCLLWSLDVVLTKEKERQKKEFNLLLNNYHHHFLFFIFLKIVLAFICVSSNFLNLFSPYHYRWAFLCASLTGSVFKFWRSPFKRLVFPEFCSHSHWTRPSGTHTHNAKLISINVHIIQFFVRIFVFLNNTLSP